MLTIVIQLWCATKIHLLAIPMIKYILFLVKSSVISQKQKVYKRKERSNHVYIKQTQ